jgi:hypothetical protein
MRTSKALPVRAAAAKVFLPVQRVGGEQHAVHGQVVDQGLHCWNLVGRPGYFLMGKDQRGLSGKGAEDMRGGAIVQMVEAAAQRLAVERDDAPLRRAIAPAQLPRVVAEGGLERGRIEHLKQVAQGVDGGRAAQSSTKDGVEPLTVDADEHENAAIRGRSAEHRQNREEQQVRQAVAPTLSAARIRNLFEGR